MPWDKLGRIFQLPERLSAEHYSHTANPVAMPLGDNLFRVFFSIRDQHNKSSIAAFDYDIQTMQSTQLHWPPMATYTQMNEPMSHGISLGSTISSGNNNGLTFMAWCCPEEQHWYGVPAYMSFTSDNMTMLTEPKILFLPEEQSLLSISYPCCITDTEGSYHLWYGATTQWETPEHDMTHRLYYSQSSDLHTWTHHGAVNLQHDSAEIYSRPSIILDDQGNYLMWYAYRLDGGKYQIGCASSNNGLDWVVKPKDHGLAPSPEGWDSEMVAYPFVFPHGDNLYLLYNGNDYGKTGIGIAKFSR